MATKKNPTVRAIDLSPQPIEEKDLSPQPELSYFDQRIKKELGITDEQNRIKLKFYEAESNTTKEVEYQIFSEDEDGNIRITPFTLNRELIQYDSQKATPTIRNIENSRSKIFYITRQKDPQSYTDKNGDVQIAKYLFPKGADTQPFLTPGLCDKWARKEKIETLVLTEGYLKAFKGYLCGLDIVGLSSITHSKQKDTEMMYHDVLTIIKDCRVENIIVLFDGDSRNISPKDIENNRDLKRRPSGFIDAIKRIRELLKDSKADVYFAMIKSDDIAGNPKGLDDLYCTLPAETKSITTDLLSFSRPPAYFHRIEIRTDVGKLYRFFMLDTVDHFYLHHQKLITDKEFIFYGTTYKYKPDDGKFEVVIQKEARDYFRVGDDYYKFVNVPNKYKQLEKRFVPRKKTTITSDYGKDIMRNIPKYEAFCNIPDHTNYQQVSYNCFNVYSQFEHESEEGECSAILEFMLHIFGEQYELGLDYVQLLYQQPTQMLPILCLVSKQNKTGKSTFIKLLKAIFTQNCTEISNEDLGAQFNFWVTKLIIACEESFIDKKPVIEKIKALSTADHINMNKKGKDQTEIDFFGKFILASNHEDSFIYATRDDVRYWVRKIPVFTGKENVRLLQEMTDEIPAFLDFLNKRDMSTNYESRMWFNESLLKTAALEKLIHNSRPGIEKEIYEHLKTIYFDFGESEVLMTPTNANDIFLTKKKQDINYLTKIFRENMGVDTLKTEDGKGIVKTYCIPYWQTDLEGNINRATHKFKGRPFVFEAKNILDPSDLDQWLEIVKKPDGIQLVIEPLIPEDLEDKLPF